jgi:predicted lysophospholipase L1 biosynthesis ABC-type transport system permease subunit
MPLLFAFGSASETSADGLTVGLPASGAAVSSLRFMERNADPNSVVAPGFAGNMYYEADPPPLVVSKELAAHFDVGPGDPLQFRFAGSGLTINGKIAAVVPLLPGVQSPNAVLVDLTTLTGYMLQVSTSIPTPNQVWLATSGPVALGSALPDGATLVTPDAATDSQFAAPSELALWVAAIGCLLLAAISLGAVALTVARARRGEVAVLRAVGIAARQQSRARLAELSSIILLSALFGVLGGFAVSAITVPNLAHSAVQDVPAGLPATLAFALVTGGVLLLGSLIVMLAIAGFSAARVRKQALDTSERIETR